MRKTNKLYLEQFLERIERIELILSSVSKEKFDVDVIVQDALILNLEVLGEISKRFSEAYKMEVQNIPWNKIQGMRNRLAHEYDGINLETVWIAVTDFVPALKPIIIKEINSIDTSKH